nr:hypothetical protein [Tanacetum cinerariifolium]
YIPGPEEPEKAPPSSDYSPEYVPESDFEMHPEDDDDEDPEEDPVDYPVDRGDDDDDEEELSEDDEEDVDDEIDIEADDEEEEEEHPAPTEPFKTDESAATPPPHPAYRTTARISIPAPVPMPTWTDSEVVRLLAISSPPASPLSPWSSPSSHIPFPPLPPILSPPSHVLSPAPPPSPIRSLGYRAAMIRLRDEAASTSHSPPLQLPSTSRREDRPEVTLPPRKRLDIAIGPKYEVGESSSAAAAKPAGCFRADYSFIATMDKEIMHDPEREVGYGITDSWDEIVETMQGAPVSTDAELGGYVREFETRVRQDTDEIYMRRAHAYIRQLMETEERMSREAWMRATDASNLVHGEVMSLCTTVLGQMSEIRELQAADRRRQTGQVTALHAQVTTLQGQQGLAGDHTQSELPEEADGRVTTALAARDALKSTNGDDSHNSRTGGAPVSTDTELAGYVKKFETRVRQHTDEIYMILDDEQTERQLLDGRLNIEAWVRATDASDLVHGEVTALQAQVTTLQGQQGLAGDPTQPWMFAEEADKIEKYVGGLPDMIHGNVVASKPKTMQEAIEIATELMDKKIRTFAERETTSKRKIENTSRTTQNQQQQQHSNKRQNTGRVYTAAPGEKKQYGGSRPLCAKCNYHHDGPCAPKYRNCNKFGHATRDYRNTTNTNNANNQRGTELGQKPTCYECG